ncbi:MAG: hypothetical protein RTV31_09635 [Candidatus Thorarchaeota archaeon]
MVDDSAQPDRKSVLSTVLLTILVILVMLFAPFAIHFDLGPGPNAIEAVIWQYVESAWQVGFWFQNPLRYFDYIVIRLLFPIQFLRYLLGKSSRKVTLLAALYSELHVGLLSLPVYISWLYNLGVFLSPDGDPTRPVFLPLPFLLLLVCLVVFIDKRRSN